MDEFPPLDQGHGQVSWSDEEKSEIDAIFARYPTKRAAALPLLWKAQRKWDWLSYDVLGLVAETLELPKSEVLSVASFYTMLKKRPTGKYIIQVCHTLSCALRGADDIVGHLEDALGIKVGQTTEDGMFTLMRVECLASCGSAPMLQVNAAEFYEFLTPEKVNELLESLRRGDEPENPIRDQWHWEVAES